MEQIALKEWAVAVRAMELGHQTIIFRKGGIQEPAGDFALTHNEFLLYPAREHQKAELLKPEFLQLLDDVQKDQTGHQVVVRSRAKVKSFHLISNATEAEVFNGRHIWNADFIRLRLDYKPDRPLYAIELEVDMLPTSIQFIESTEQFGCRSWVSVESDSIEGAKPPLSAPFSTNFRPDLDKT